MALQCHLAIQVGMIVRGCCCCDIGAGGCGCVEEEEEEEEEEGLLKCVDPRDPTMGRCEGLLLL